MGLKTAAYPTAPWDGLTSFRTSRRNNRAPDYEDWDEVVAEIIAIETDLYPMASDLVIWVAPHGKSTGNGRITNPYATLALAIAAVTSTKKTICLMPGAYTIAVDQALSTTTGVKIIGIGGSKAVTLNALEADAALSLLPANAAAFEVTIQGVTIGQFAAKVGLDIDDTGATATTGTITVNLQDVVFDQDASGDAITTTHAVALDLTINTEDCVFEGLVTVVCVSATDAFTFVRSDFPGGFTSTGAYAAVHKFMFCDAKENAMTGHASAICIALYCTAVGKTLLANDTDFNTFAAGGTLISPTSA